MQHTLRSVALGVFGFGVSLPVVVAGQTDRIARERFSVVAVESQAARVGFFDGASGRRLGGVEVGFKPHEIEVSPDGKTAYVTNFGIEDYDHRIGTPGTSVSVVDVRRMRERARLSTSGVPIGDSVLAELRAPHGVKLRPRRRRELYVNTEVGGDYMLVYRGRRHRLRRAFAIPTGTHNFVFSPDGDALYVFAGPGGVFRLDPETGARRDSVRLATPVRGLHYAADGRSIIATGAGEVAMIDPRDLRVQRAYAGLGVGQLLYPKPTPDGRYALLPAVYESQVLVLDLASGAVVHRLDVAKNPVTIALSPDGKTAYVSGATAAYFSVIDLTTFAVSRFAEADGVNGVAVARAVR